MLSVLGISSHRTTNKFEKNCTTHSKSGINESIRESSNTLGEDVEDISCFSMTPGENEADPRLVAVSTGKKIFFNDFFYWNYPKKRHTKIKLMDKI